MSINKIGLGLLFMLAPTAALADQHEKMIEIYHIAPGKQVEFLKLIALYDEANRRAGLPPRDLYVHSDGGAWDFLLIQDEDVDPAKAKVRNEALRILGAPTGQKFWVAIRQTIAEHTDTVASGPTTAGDWLKQLGDPLVVPADSR